MEAEERPTKMRKLDTSENTVGNEDTHVANNSSDVIENGVTAMTDGLDESNTGEPRTTLPLLSDNAPIVDTISKQNVELGMSKNQLKKLRKQQEWDAKRDDRKALRKEQTKAKRERKRAAKQQEIAEAAERGEDVQALTKAKRQAMQRPVQLPVTFLIDCNFDDLMRDNERVSLGSQITRCYSDNKNSRYRAHLTVCSFGGKLKDRYENVLLGVYKQWRGTRFLDEGFVEAAEKANEWMFAKDSGELKGAFSELDSPDDAAKEALKQQGEVVYLSSEADETLTELKPYSTYIIGGLVDKNREKGICYKRATRAGVRTAKLPIGQYLQMSSRKVLATNHVHEIMLKWLECKDWGEAFMQIIPKRKGGQLRDSAGREAGGDNRADEEDPLDEYEAQQEDEAPPGDEAMQEVPDAEQSKAEQELPEDDAPSKALEA